MAAECFKSAQSRDKLTLIHEGSNESSLKLTTFINYCLIRTELIQISPTLSAVCTMGGRRREGREVGLGFVLPILDRGWVD